VAAAVIRRAGAAERKALESVKQIVAAI